MSLSRWLSRFRARLQSKNRPRRRLIYPFSRLYDWELEDRCLLSGVPVPLPNNPPALNTIMWISGDPINPAGIKGLPDPPVKTVTITNTSTTQTIYPFLRDANTGATTGGYYDPQDYHNQEYRLYAGYVQNGKDYLGLPPNSSITFRVPVVFWNAENTYIATDGSDLIPTQAGQLNPFTYDSTSQRNVSLSTDTNSWVTSFTSTDSSNTGGLVMFYHVPDKLASTPALAAPAQLAEFTIRDPYLTKFGLTAGADTQVIIDYDVSYVDNAHAPLTVEASAVPVQIPTLVFPDKSANPPAPPYGWTGANLTYDAMQTLTQDFINNTQGTTAYLGQYFTNPNSPAPPPSPNPPPPPGWPAYYNPEGLNKVPGGQNIFLQSPLNGTPSDLDNNRYMLTSGGSSRFSDFAGGLTPNTPNATTLPLIFTSQDQYASFATDISQMLKDGEVDFAYSTATFKSPLLGTLTKFNDGGKDNSSVVVSYSPGAQLPANTGVTYLFSRPRTDYAATDITNLWYSWAQYYINQYASFNGETAHGTLTVEGTLKDKNQAALLTLDNAPTTPLAVGMTVSGNGITPAAGTNVTIVNVKSPTQVYLSQLPQSAGPFTDTYTFGKPQPIPFSDPTGIENITVTNGGSGYVQPLTVTINGGNGAGATAVVDGITNGQITSIKITNPGGNYDSAPTVIFNGGGGSGATATAVLTNGQVTGITVNNGGSGYSAGPVVSIAGGGGTGATASAIVDPATGRITNIVITNSGTHYSSSSPITVNITSDNGSGATASATVGTYVSVYPDKLPADPNTMLQGGTVLQFAGSVYEALEAEGSIPPSQSLRFYNPIMPPPVGLVGATIGSDLGDLPNANGGASNLGGQVRDLIKSVLRGVWDFNAVTDQSVWYPNPSKQIVSTLPFNPYNLDPYVWFIHDVLNMSGYGFSTDDDVANVGAFTSPYATDPSKTILPNNVQMSFGGISTLPQQEQWYPGVPWGTVHTTGTVSTDSNGNAFVTLTPGQVTQFYQVVPVTPGQSGVAYVTGRGIPTGTTINIRSSENNLQFSLNVPNGQTVTPSNGTIDLTFSGKPPSPLAQSPAPTPTPMPPPLQAPTPTSTPTINNLFDLVQDEIFLTIDEVAASVEQALNLPQTPARNGAIQAHTNSIDANPFADTPLGQFLLFVTRIEILNFLSETPIPFNPNEVL